MSWGIQERRDKQLSDIAMKRNDGANYFSCAEQVASFYFLKTFQQWQPRFKRH